MDKIKEMDRAGLLIAQGMRLRERSRAMAMAAANKLAAANKILKAIDESEKKPDLKVVK